MTKISYESDDKKASIEVEGGSVDLFKGACRIIAKLKESIELKDGVKFEDMLLEGIKFAEKEKSFDCKTMEKLLKILDELESILND